jgi:hypothetical protein
MNTKATIMSPDLAESDAVPTMAMPTTLEEIPLMQESLDSLSDRVKTGSGHSRAKRREQDADTRDDTRRDDAGARPAAKVARLAISAEEGTKEAKDGHGTTKTPLTTEEIMDLLKDLWSDDEIVIEKALSDIANLAVRDLRSEENETKMRLLLSGHTAVLHVVQKHAGCRKIQEEGMRALGNFSFFMPTKELLGDIGYVEVILTRMGQYSKSWLVQQRGCSNIRNLVKGV